MYSFFNQILSEHQCGFRQGHSTQHSLKKSGVGGILLIYQKHLTV